MIRVLWFFLVYLPLASQAQFTYFLDQTIPVKDLQGDDLSLAWAGGLNATQYNTMDLDEDGTEDLVLFDRMANKVITFIARDNQYVPAPEFEALFPAEVSNWILLRDYNCDGKKDIFTGDILGIKVFMNVSPAGGSLAWEQFFFYTGFPGAKSTVLLTQGFSSKINLQLQFDDLPSISDVDGDGDLDILNVRFVGNGTVEFHQNFSIERYGTCDSLDFKRITQSWGNFRECNCGVFAFSGVDCSTVIGGRTKHAGGKSLLALDLNGDQQQDLLFSEAECTQLYALPNQGTTFNPLINSSSAFPETSPANFVLFPAAYYEDVDFDGKKDLLVSPNIFSKEFLNTNLQRSNWFYKNTGTTTNPVFSLVERDFLQRHMIDVGDNAVPAFADYDGDGDFDMLISMSTSENFASAIYLYENTGTPSSPAFKLNTADYLGFSAARLYNVKIQFADINGDSTPDLIFTGTSFDTGLTSLYFIRNKSQTLLDFTGTSVQMLEFQLTYHENLYVADVNEDGLPDILAGRSEGQLEYWKNSGINGSPFFALEEENFLGFNASILRQNLTCATADLDGDGKMDLIVGDQTGKPGIISDYHSVTDHESSIERNILFNPPMGGYRDKNLGGRIWPTVVNLFNANKPAIVVGNIMGGIHLLKHDEGQSLPENPTVDIYPNPVAKTELLKVKTDRQGTMQIISVLGQLLSDPILLKANEIYQYTLPPLASGLYLLKFTSHKKSHTERFVVY